MDFEAPVDSWYVYVAVVIVSITFAAVALSVAPTPPPDAQQAANTIEAATASEYVATASYEHDASVAIINRNTVTLNDGDESSHASFAYGTVVPVNGHERLENVTHGQSIDEAYEREFDDPYTDGTAVFFEEVTAADQENTGEELIADGELVARTVAIENDSAVGLEARATDADEFATRVGSKTPHFEPDEMAVPEQLDFRTNGTPTGTTEIRVEGTSVASEIEPAAIPEFWNALEAEFLSWVCPPAVTDCVTTAVMEPVHTTEGAIDHDEPDSAGMIELLDDDFSPTNSTTETVELWTGTYDLEVSATGPSFRECTGVIEDASTWTDLCTPEVTMSEFDDPHWHDVRNGVNYVTLVRV